MKFDFLRSFERFCSQMNLVDWLIGFNGISTSIGYLMAPMNLVVALMAVMVGAKVGLRPMRLSLMLETPTKRRRYHDLGWCFWRYMVVVCLAVLKCLQMLVSLFLGDHLEPWLKKHGITFRRTIIFMEHNTPLHAVH